MRSNGCSSRQDVHDFWNEASCGKELFLAGSGKDGYMAQMRKRYELEPSLPAFARPQAMASSC